MNRLMLSLAAAGALLFGNAAYAVPAAATPVAKPMNPNAAVPTVSPSVNASPVAKAAVAKTRSCRDDKGKYIKCAPPKKHAACRDQKGKFIKCPPHKMAECRDAKGHFTKCPAST